MNPHISIHVTGDRVTHETHIPAGCNLQHLGLLLGQLELAKAFVLREITKVSQNAQVKE